ncbi:MAG: DUF3791 domain-containing protein [Muribaculaceae bacterium]|nr:DUF3791 domain-containing protein [Bacteroides sp.]MBD5420559.1 DUF3791 domain-containing protein [Bacteroides sp.]MDE5848061.1 DUF3791 domain-containing protein [Muribaculaceae bacterium]MDE6193298.1 DUF3791 domain-containing protein [Muribaculaceae bacterium]MDE6855148.1 DUF3791 domain-containing protein [Muribaculaceae bacterium]
MDYYNKSLKDILRWGRMGAISCRIAEKLSIPPLQALKDFYRSVTCEKFHDKATGLYLYSDYYIADSYLIEKGLYQS